MLVITPRIQKYHIDYHVYYYFQKIPDITNIGKCQKSDVATLGNEELYKMKVCSGNYL